MRDFSKLWKARLILEDGSIWRATSFGAEGECGGEMVFNTALSGYQEVLTDPSYTGQVVVMTNPLIGNYGINAADEESAAPALNGFVVRENSALASNYRSEESLVDYLKRHNIIGLEGVDTRALTLRLRDRGSMRVFMTTATLSDDELRQKLALVPDLVGQDMVEKVTCSASHQWDKNIHADFPIPVSEDGRRYKVAAFDFGAKASIFSSLKAVGCDVTVVPASTSADEIMAMKLDGVFLSNGPGDPRPLEGMTQTVKTLLGQVPIFGICLGHQILAQALGAKIEKMKFGHHGSNQPVKDLTSGRIEITSQNHGFAVTAESLKDLGVEITHINLNDQSVEGMALPELNAFSVQYHPEASPGPHDSAYLFERFRDLMASQRDSVDGLASQEA